MNAYKRRRGAAIIKNNKGILLVRSEKLFNLPGGAANKGESRKMATIREINEETGLKVVKIIPAFDYIGIKKKDYKKRGKFRDYNKVFYVKVKGKLKPSNEIKEIYFWKKSSKIPLDEDTKNILIKASKFL